MTPATRTWHKPELVVLVRSNPEESVLNACKGTSGVTPTAGIHVCHVHSCQANAPS